jgi:hypothetical protein
MKYVDIMKGIYVGCRVLYCTHDEWESKVGPFDVNGEEILDKDWIGLKVNEGIVTEIQECVNSGYDFVCEHCVGAIGIDGNNPKCKCYGYEEDREYCLIKAIIPVMDFLSEKEMEI